MKYSLYFFVLVSVLVLFSCNKDNIQPSEMESTGLIQTVQEEDVVFNGEYLVFKTIEIFDSICQKLNEMDEDEFLQWENNLGFKSALSLKWEFQDKLSQAKSMNEVIDIKNKYADQFYFDSNEVIKYPFYASALANILNIEGYVQIENSLYRFTKSDEIISYDANKDRIEKVINDGINFKSDKLLSIYGKDDLMKSGTSNTLAEGLKSDVYDGKKRRLIYSIESFVFSTVVNFDPYIGGYTYKHGYQLYLVLNSEEKGWFNIWNTDRVEYDITDQYIDWSEVGVSSVGYTGTLTDKHYNKTRDEIRYAFINKLYYTQFYPGSATFTLDQLDVTFESNHVSSTTISL